AHASDILFTTIREGRTTMSELADTVGRVASIASSAKVPFEEVGGALAFVTKSGIKTDEAVVGLRALFTSIIGPSKEAADTAKKFGIELSATALKTKGLAGFMNDLKEKTHGNVEALKKLFPNVRAFNVAVKIAGGDIKDFNRIMGEMGKASEGAGATQKALEKITSSASFQFNKLKTQLKNLPNAMLTNFEKPIASALEAINAFVSKNGVLLIADGVKFVIDAFDTFQRAGANVKAFLASIASAGAELGIKWTEMALAINGAIQSVQKFLGFSVSEKLKSEESALKNRIKSLREFQKAQEDGAVAELNAADELSKKIAGFRQMIVESKKKQIEDEKAIAEQQKAEDLANAQAELEQLTAHEQTKWDIKQAFIDADKERQQTINEEKALEKELQGEKEYQILVDQLGKEKALRELNRIQHIADEKKRSQEILKLRELGNKTALENEKKANKQRIQNMDSTLGTIASLQSSSNSTLFAIGKAAALAQHALKVPEAIDKALAAAPPPFNFGLAALVGTAMAVQGARIASAKPPAYASGGIVEGSSQLNDQLTARVNAGEMILNKRQQSNLFQAVNSGNVGGGGSSLSLNIQGDLIGDDHFIDGLIDKINDAIEFRNKELKV
ncbi:MAG: phage tail tape measure protein, partial [Alphaproteobacteria bacterium]